MPSEVIKVDWRGRDAAGDEYTDVAAREQVAAGFLVNVPVILQYPDGRRVRRSRVEVTPAGIEFLRTNLPRH